METEDTKIPLGYADTSYFALVYIQGSVIAVPKNKLDRPFIEVLLESRKVEYKKIDDEYFRVVSQASSEVEVKTEKNILVWHGIPAMAEGPGLNQIQGGNPTGKSII